MDKIHAKTCAESPCAENLRARKTPILQIISCNLIINVSSRLGMYKDIENQYQLDSIIVTRILYKITLPALQMLIKYSCHSSLAAFFVASPSPSNRYDRFHTIRLRNMPRR
jgi:hypothetical protein